MGRPPCFVRHQSNGQEIISIRHSPYRIQVHPFYGPRVTIRFDRKVGKPAVFCSTVPMPDVCRNPYYIARMKLPGFLSLLLKPSSSAGDQQYLSSRMPMPAIAASRLESDIPDRAVPLVAPRRKHFQICLTDEVPAEHLRHCVPSRKHRTI